MRFSNSFLDEIRDRVPISDVIGRRVSWDKRKTNVPRGDYWACCPFHGEKSPSFHCEDRKGRYHCFGCGVTGDHFRFMTELEGLSFPEAVQQIADMAGVAMPIADPVMEKREKERTSLLDVMELATKFFQDQLQTALGARARAYLRDRGLTGRTIETFRLGFASDSRNALKEFLAGQGVAKEQIEACGLVVHGPEIPVSYDRFRDRIMFPILSSREKVIAFGGRAMSPDAPAKYLNSNETELFHKGSVLYNFTRARRATQGANGEGTIIAVEGYMDVIALHQAGVENAVAPLGTALTENQLELLWRMTPQPVLCFDGDGAGIRAANRAADLALPHIKPGRTVRFALLPDGKDPDDLVRNEGRAPFDKVMSQAKPLSEMLWDREVAASKFDTPEARAELEARVTKLVAVVADESVRRQYQQVMRDKLYALFRPAVVASNFSGGGQKGARAQKLDLLNTARLEKGSAGSARLNQKVKSSPVESLLLRESVLALTVVNHPALMQDEYDEIASIDYDSRELQRLWSGMLGAAAAVAGPHLTREYLVERLEEQGFGGLIQALEKQIRNARLWIATEQAAMEDAREGYRQALAFHKRAKALRFQKIELEREIAEATEAGNGEVIDLLMRALQEVHFEGLRLENQEAIIDGFGVLSGRVKGAASH
ncbi:DNA primase [Rhizobium sp. Root708]|nr:DNA primase [Rhizobium sp. Root708]KRB50903.1 DNA primase [Rhizobium sp. Root708]